MSLASYRAALPRFPNAGFFSHGCQRHNNRKPTLASSHHSKSMGQFGSAGFEPAIRYSRTRLNIWPRSALKVCFRTNFKKRQYVRIGQSRVFLYSLLYGHSKLKLFCLHRKSFTKQVPREYFFEKSVGRGFRLSVRTGRTRTFDLNP